MIVLPNCPQTIVAFYATLKIGGVVVMPNPDADARAIANQMRQTAAKVLVTLRPFAELAEAARQLTPVEHLIFADIRETLATNVYRKLLAVNGVSDNGESGPLKSGFLMSDVMFDASELPPKVRVGPNDLAAVLFTSGTTDEPKGVRLTHANLVANALQTRHWVPDMKFGEERFLAVIPFLHSYGMTACMNIPIAMGATIILLPVFELQQVLEHVKKHKPTIFPGVPSMYTAINHAPNVRSFGLSSIKACISGAAPLPVEVQEEFEKLTRGRLVEGYGLTEASPITHANPLYGVRKVGSIGIPIPNTDAKIVDLATGEDLEPGRIGEVCVKGPQVMQGYWGENADDDPESVLKGGWLHTGDVGIMDDDGYFTIISRKRDTIMSGDFSVYPRDVEEVLYENSKVQEVAVVGVPHAESGQKVKAFVVPRPGTTLSKEELLDLCRRRLEEYAVPWEIEFRQELPKSFIGKVLRRLLVEENPS
jgi:long-chain acyl-CoA synthetase